MMSCKPSLTSCRTSCGTRLEEGESSLKVVHMYNSWLDYRLEYLTLTNDGLCEPKMEEGKKKNGQNYFLYELLSQGRQTQQKGTRGAKHSQLWVYSLR